MRERGYYWVRFDYEKWNKAARGAGLFAPPLTTYPHWEIGSWDSNSETWCLIGSRDQWYESQMLEIGSRIKNPYEEKEKR